ncbi:unnamed protein product, partial [Brenthis ino]
MSARKYKSGAEKRKLQFSREQERNKCAKIETFFKSEHINANEIAINPLKNVKEGILCEENLTDGSKKSQNEEKNTSDENMQDFENQKKNTNDENVQYLDFQQPSGSSENEIGVQQKGGNTDTEVERNLENIKFEFEKYVDVGLWPDLLNNDFINFVLSHEMTDFQNKDPKNIYSASMKKYKEQNRSFSNSFGENDDEKVDFRKEARNLFNKLAKLETAILIVFWEEILERFNVVNKKVQSPGLDIGEGNKLIVSLKEFVKNIRQQSDQKLKEYEEKAKKLSTSVGTDYSDINKRRITLKFSDKSTDKVSVNCAEKFKRDTLNVALDKMIMDLNNRSQAYETYSKKFKFLMDLQDKNQEHIDLESVRNIIDYYPNDVDEHLVNECIQLKSYLLQSKTESYTSCSEIFWLIYEKKLVDVFPNCYTILKIFLTMPITSCEAERSFSRMSYIENKYRTTMSNYRLNHLSVLSINCDLTKDLQCDDQIKEFAAQKCRKVAL